MVEELKLAIKVDDDAIEQSLLKQFANAEKMANKVVLTFNNIDLDDKAIEAKFKEMQKMAGKNPIDLSIDKSSIEMLSAISKQLGNIFDIAKGKSIIDSSTTVADVNKVTNAINGLNSSLSKSNTSALQEEEKQIQKNIDSIKKLLDLKYEVKNVNKSSYSGKGNVDWIGIYKSQEEAISSDLSDKKEKLHSSLNLILSEDKNALSSLEEEATKLKTALQSVQEMSNRISSNSSISDLDKNKGSEGWYKGYAEAYKAIDDRLGELNNQYGLTNKELEEYITLQVKAEKIMDRMISHNGGVKGSGAKDKTELKSWIKKSFATDLGLNPEDIYSGLFGNITNALYDGNGISLFDSEGTKRNLREISSEILNYKSTISEFSGSLGANEDAEKLREINSILNYIKNNASEIESTDFSSQIKKASELVDFYSQKLSEGEHTDYYSKLLKDAQDDLQNLISLQERLNATKDKQTNEIITEQQSSYLVEQQNKIQEELKETQKQAEQTSEALSNITDGNKSNISSENDSLQSTIEALKQLSKLPGGDTLSLGKIMNHIAEGAKLANPEVKKLLESLKLIDSEGKIISTHINEGTLNSGVDLNDKFAIISRNDAIENVDKLIEKEKEAQQQGILLAKTLASVDIGKLHYDIQELAQGSSVHQMKNSTLQQFIDETRVLCNATDEQILKLYSDAQKLSDLGFKLDLNPSNIRYDENNGFSFIDLELRKINEEAPQTVAIMHTLTQSLMGFMGQRNRLNWDDEENFYTKDNYTYLQNMLKTYERLQQIFSSKLSTPDFNQAFADSLQLVKTRIADIEAHFENLGTPIKDVFQGNDKATTDASTTAIKEENDALKQIPNSATEAANAKEKFANANKEVKASAESSSTSLDEEKKKIENVGDSAEETKKKLDDVIFKPNTEGFDEIVSKLDIAKDKIEEISKITKSSVWSESQGEYLESYNIKYKNGTSEIRGESSNKKGSNVLRANEVAYDAKAAEQEAKALNQAWEEANKVNNALNETKNTLSSLPRMTELDTQFSSLDTKLSSLNSELTSGKISVADYKKEVKSLTSEYSKLVTVQQNRDVETCKQNAKAAEQEAKAVKRLNDELEGYNNQIPKKPIDGQRSDYFEGFVQNYKNAIAEAQKYLDTLGDSPITKEVKEEWERLIDVIKKAKKEMDAVPNADRGSDALSRRKEIDAITKYLEKFTGISKQAKQELKGLVDQLQSGDPSVNVKKIHDRFLELTVAERIAGREGKSFFDIFSNKVVYGLASKLAMYYLSFYDFIRYTRNAINAVKELDTALIDLKKTTTMSASELERFYYDSNDVAKKLGVTTAEIINQASAWSRFNKIDPLYSNVY